MSLANIIAVLFISLGSLSPVIEFDTLQHNFGNAKEGDKLTHVFTFKNTGDKDLEIIHINTSCGCTAANYTKEPVPPGESGSITVTFNTYGKKGRNNKTIYVRSTGSEKPIELKIVAFVE